MNCLCQKCQYSENKNDLITNIKSHHQPKRINNLSIQSIPNNIKEYILTTDENYNKNNIRIEKYNNDKDFLEIIEYPDLILKSNKLQKKKGFNLKKNFLKNKKNYINKDFENDDDNNNSIDEKLSKNEIISIRKSNIFPNEIDNYNKYKIKKNGNCLELKKEIFDGKKNNFYLQNDNSFNNISKENNIYIFKNNSVLSSAYKNMTTCSDLLSHKNNSIKIEHKGLEEQISIISSD